MHLRDSPSCKSTALPELRETITAARATSCCIVQSSTAYYHQQMEHGEPLPAMTSIAEMYAASPAYQLDPYVQWLLGLNFCTRIAMSHLHSKAVASHWFMNNLSQLAATVDKGILLVCRALATLARSRSAWTWLPPSSTTRRPASMTWTSRTKALRSTTRAISRQGAFQTLLLYDSAWKSSTARHAQAE